VPRVVVPRADDLPVRGGESPLRLSDRLLCGDFRPLRFDQGCACGPQPPVGRQAALGEWLKHRPIFNPDDLWSILSQ